MATSKDVSHFPERFISVFWNNQFRTTIDLPTESKYGNLNGKTAIVTGANSGLGLETSKQLLSLDISRLIIAVRRIDAGDAAASMLRKTYPAADIRVWSLDMLSYDSVLAFVQKCDAELEHIDYVILNAGLSPLKFEKSEHTGHERAIQVNHLSTVLLTIQLLPVLKKKSKGREPAKITVVNSVMAHLCKFPNRDHRPLLGSFDDTNITPWNPQERYGVSKLLYVTMNMVDPGLTKGTGLSRDITGLLRVVLWVFLAIAARPLERGAATYVDALLGHGEESHGSFLMNTDIAPYATFCYTDEGKNASEQIWKETMDELSFSGVKDILSNLNQDKK